MTAPRDEDCLPIPEAERAQLERLARGRSTAQAVARRARVLLACAAPGATDSAVAVALGVSRPCVATWRRRYLEHGLPGLGDAPRCGAPRQVGDRTVVHLVALALGGEAPAGATGWSTRSLARHLGLSQTTVSRILRGFGLQLPDPGSLMPSLSPVLIRGVRDVVGIYVNPPDLALVLCISQEQKTETPPCATAGRPVLWPTAEAWLDRSQQGICGVFAALQARAGTASPTHDRKQRRAEFGAFLRCVDDAAPASSELHLMLGHDSAWYAHKACRVLAMARPCHVCTAPADTSWFNLVKCWFAVLADRDRCGSTSNVRALEAALRRYASGQDPGPLAWTGGAATAATDHRPIRGFGGLWCTTLAGARRMASAGGRA